MARHITKPNCRAYLKAMREALDPVIGSPSDDWLPDHHRWENVTTTLGTLCYISISADYFSFCMETRFDDPVLAKSGLGWPGCNPYSGKWNHYADKDTGPKAAAVFMLTELCKVIPALNDVAFLDAAA